MTHQQIAIEKYGSASTLHVSELSPRPPGDDEVAIDVAYSGVNFADIQMRLGFYPDAPKKPFVPGYEVSGHVTAVGKAVTGLRVGDAVIAGTYFGGYASHVTIPARQVFKLPSTVDLAAGAAIPVNYFTAQLALFEMARVRKGDRVLIECATGGVGVLAIQMARHAGAEVTGLTTSPHKKPFIESLGAIAYTREEFRANESLRGYDMILNASGGGEINWQRARLGITGRMVCLGISSGVKDGKRNFLRIGIAALRMPRISVLKLFDANTGIYALNALHVLEDQSWIEKLTKAMVGVEEMSLKPHVGKVFPAAEVGAAHAFLETKQATGKVLLQWSGGN
ncbi:MAG: zinc-binding dehydrogenase [Kofleriaceae bacterium]|nr:zinc-binding dehydrogenase [Kofleriaceae bacterium]